MNEGLPRLHNRQMTVIVLLAGVLVLVESGQPTQAASSDPLNVPLESLGATGYDMILCSDRWNTCSDFDRQQFDQRYPGRPLEELSLYPPAHSSTEGYGTRWREGHVHDDRPSSGIPRPNRTDSFSRSRGRDW